MPLFKNPLRKKQEIVVEKTEEDLQREWIENLKKDPLHNIVRTTYNLQLKSGNSELSENDLYEVTSQFTDEIRTLIGPLTIEKPEIALPPIGMGQQPRLTLDNMSKLENDYKNQGTVMQKYFYSGIAQLKFFKVCTSEGRTSELLEKEELTEEEQEKMLEIENEITEAINKYSDIEKSISGSTGNYFPMVLNDTREALKIARTYMKSRPSKPGQE